MHTAGVPYSVPAMTINKACGSGLKAMMLVADTIRPGDDLVGIAGGMENMYLYPYALLNARFGMRMGLDLVVDLLLHDALFDPESGRHFGDTTEEALAERGSSLDEQDEYAINFCQHAQTAIKRGFQAKEIVPLVKTTRKGGGIIDCDEEPTRMDINCL